jgi:integrase
MASVNVLRGNLYLLAKLPDRGDPSRWRQQRIPMKLADTPANQRTARRRLAELERQLEQGSFSWAFWTDDDSKALRWRDAIALLHRKKVILGRTGESTWTINYLGRLRQIDERSPCTTTSMEQALMKYRRNSSSYKEMYYLLKHISKLTGIAMPEVPIPTYGQAKVVEVPTDAEIIDWVLRSPQPVRWYFGMMATYGLRPHEIEHAVIQESGFCNALQGKVMSSAPGLRVIPPLEPEWIQLFDLMQPQRRPRRTASDERNDAVSKWLHKEKRKLGIAWRPYALRHAFAGRLWRHGGAQLDLFVAAGTMGHTINEHVKTYRAHIAPVQLSRYAAAAFGEDYLERARAAVLSSAPAPPDPG